MKMITKNRAEAFVHGAWMPVKEAHKVHPNGLDGYGIPLSYRTVTEERPILTTLVWFLRATALAAVGFTVALGAMYLAYRFGII